MKPTRVWIWIAVLMVLHAAIYAHSASVADSARDLYWAWQIAQGQQFPLAGPALAHVVHLSPLWFYLLAVPLLFSTSWLAAALWVGLISALQYPLAFLLGRRLGGDRCGLLFAGLCALPGWDFTYYLVLNHTDAVAPVTLLVLLCTTAWWQTRKPVWLVWLPVAVVLGVHAHPVVYVTGLIAAAVLAADAVRGRLPWRWLLSGIALSCVLFVPWLVDQAQQGWPDWTGGSAWAAGQSPLANLGGIFSLWTGIWVRGPQAAWQVMLDLGRGGQIIAWLQIALLSTGALATAVCAFKQPLARIVLAAWLLAFAATAILREVTPAYMTGALYVFSAGIAAWGLAQLGRWPLWIVLVIAPLALLGIGLRLATIATHGDLKLPNHALADVKRADLSPGESFGYFPAWARGDLARFICAHEAPVTVHGPASVVLEQSYALAMRMRCGKQDLYLGGQAPGNHYFGVPRYQAAALSGGAQVGPWRLFEVREIYHPSAPVNVPEGDVYPPRAYPDPVPQTIELSVPAGPERWLAVTNLYLVWMEMEVEVRLNGDVVTPSLETRATQYFRCDDCQGGEWEIQITAPNPNFVEVVDFKDER